MEKRLSLSEQIMGMIMSVIILLVMIMTIVGMGTSVLAGTKKKK